MCDLSPNEKKYIHTQYNKQIPSDSRDTLRRRNRKSSERERPPGYLRGIRFQR